MFISPDLRVSVWSGIFKRQHLCYVVPNLVPHAVNAAGVGVVVVFTVIEELGWKASTAEVIRDVLAFEIECLVRMLYELQGLWFLEANEFDYHMRHECVSSCSIEG